jgi:hypothetical protein
MEASETVTEAPIGICNTCCRELGAIDGTARTAICEPCERGNRLVERGMRRLGYVLRDTFRPLFEGVEAIRHTLQRGEAHVCIKSFCDECKSLVEIGVRERLDWRAEAHLGDRLRGVVAMGCPLCGAPLKVERDGNGA